MVILSNTIGERVYNLKKKKKMNTNYLTLFPSPDLSHSHPPIYPMSTGVDLSPVDTCLRYNLRDVTEKKRQGTLLEIDLSQFCRDRKGKGWISNITSIRSPVDFTSKFTEFGETSYPFLRPYPFPTQPPLLPSTSTEGINRD